MADNDLIFNINAQDNASAQLDATAASVDRVTQAEQRNAETVQSAAQGSTDLAGATDKVTEANSGLADSTEKVSQSTGNATVQIGGFQGALLTLNAGINVAQDLLGSFKQAWDFTKEGAAIERIGVQFKQVASDAGISGDELVAAMTRAARGTVDDEELMQVATRSLTQGVITSQDQLVKFTEIARASAVRFGGDTAQALQSILYATEVGAQRQLKATLGVVDFTKSYEDLAKQLGKRKQDLSDEEMLQARVNAVLAKGSELVDKVGASGDDALTKMQRFEATIADLGDTAKVTFVDTLGGPAVDALDIMINGNQRLADAFTGTAAKMKQSVVDGSMSITDYNKALQGMADQLRNARIPNADLLQQENQLNFVQVESIRITNALTDVTKQATDAAQANADAKAAAAADATDLVSAITNEESAMKRSADAFRDQTLVMSEARTLAIKYTDDEQKLADLQGKLAALDAQIASQGSVHTAIVNNQKMSEEQRAVTLQKLAVAQEDITQIQRKAGETDAEYNLRLTEAKGKVDSLSESLGTHTVALGGATKAQEAQRAALQEQIDTFQKATEVQKATDIFNALTKAFQDGKLSADEYTARAEALNSVTHLYTDTALKAATQQELLIKSFSDPAADNWRGQLLKNESALDGVASSADEAAQKVNTLAKSAKDFVDSAKAAPAKITVDTNEAKTNFDNYAKSIAAATAKVTTPIEADTADATKALNDYSSGPLNDAAKPVTTPIKADTVQANRDLDYYQRHIGDIPLQKQTIMDVLADKALQKLSDLLEAQNKITNKTVTYTIIEKHTTVGPSPLPGGAQAGANFIVPPNPSGGFGDYYPVVAAPGERVIVQTPAQQAAAQAGGAQTQIVNNETYNLYDTLITRQVAEQRRIDGLKSLVGNM